jgi:hypothetical protein
LIDVFVMLGMDANFQNLVNNETMNKNIERLDEHLICINVVVNIIKM